MNIELNTCVFVRQMQWRIFFFQSQSNYWQYSLGKTTEQSIPEPLSRNLQEHKQNMNIEMNNSIMKTLLQPKCYIKLHRIEWETLF